MADSQSDLTAARERIRRAFDPELLRTAGAALVETLADHLRRVTESAGLVQDWRSPPENIAAADAYLSGPATGEVERFAELVRTMLARGHNLHDPRYIGHQVPASVPIAGLFDAVGSVTNQVMAIYEMGPWAASVEAALVERLGRRLGLPAGGFAGFVTHGGSLGNLTALLTARNVALPEAWGRGMSSGDRSPVLVVHGDAHYSITRAAGVLGLGTSQVLRAALDSQGRLDAANLDEMLSELQSQQRPAIAVVACACSTPIGAFDPLEEIAEVCRRHGVWLHVDAAHGGAACFSDRHRKLIAGLERADSFVVDAHKMLFVPALCAFVFYRNREHRYEAFRQDAPYLFDPSAPGMAEYDCGMKTLECTKRAAAYGLWGVWSMFGEQLFADFVDSTFALAADFHRMLADAEDFEPLHEPQANIVAFRYVPAAVRHAPADELDRLQLTIRRKLLETGEFYITQTKRNGRAVLRVTVINPLTGPVHLERLLQAIRRA